MGPLTKLLIKRRVIIFFRFFFCNIFRNIIALFILGIFFLPPLKHPQIWSTGRTGDSPMLKSWERNRLEVACYSSAHLVRTITRSGNMNSWKSRFFVPQFKALCKIVTGLDFLTYESLDLVFSISALKKKSIFLSSWFSP